MKTLFFIIFFIFSFNVFSQFEGNEYGFVLTSHIRKLKSRQLYIDKYTDFSTQTYHDKYKLDSILLGVLPEFGKLKYKVIYTALYDDYHIAISETVTIKHRLSWARSYRIEIDYLPNGAVTKHVTFPVK